MSAEVIPFPRCLYQLQRAIARVGPVATVVTQSHILDSSSGPLLELQLVLRLNEIQSYQRRILDDLLESGDLLTLTLTPAD